MKEVLKLNNKIADLSRTFTYARNFIYLGRGFQYPVALEGALKLKEISYIHAEGYPAAEMKHGPIALIDSDMPVVVIATHNFMYEKVLSNIQEIKARQGRVIAIVSKGDETLVLEDGTKFHGKSFGYEAPAALAEAVFNTAMMGYPESLTDPSYAGQLMT